MTITCMKAEHVLITEHDKTPFILPVDPLETYTMVMWHKWKSD